MLQSAVLFAIIAELIELGVAPVAYLDERSLAWFQRMIGTATTETEVLVIPSYFVSFFEGCRWRP